MLIFNHYYLCLQAEDAVTPVTVLRDSIVGSMSRMQNEIHILISTKESLEQELGSQLLQKDMLARDVSTLCSQLEAMKAAYSGLESEMIDYRNSQTKKLLAAGDPAEAEELKRKLAAAHDLLSALQEDLGAATQRALALEKFPAMMTNLECRLITVEGEKSELNAAAIGLRNEVASYKKLTDSLKDKIRELSSRATNDNSRDFLDTFEEVMKDEMLAMKAAFEAKLKAVKEDSEMVSRRHQQEIQRIQMVAPAAALRAGLGGGGGGAASQPAFSSVKATSATSAGFGSR